MNGHLLRTARHEAAHAVVTVSLRVAKVDPALTIHNDSAGTTNWKRVAPQPIADEVLKMVAAGAIAERIHDRPDTSAADWVFREAYPKTRSEGGDLSRDVVEFDRFIAHARITEREAITASEIIVRANWRAITDVADELVRRIHDDALPRRWWPDLLRVAGDELHSIVEAALARQGNEPEEGTPDGRPQA